MSWNAVLLKPPVALESQELAHPILFVVVVDEVVAADRSGQRVHLVLPQGGLQPLIPKDRVGGEPVIAYPFCLGAGADGHSTDGMAGLWHLVSEAEALFEKASDRQEPKRTIRMS